MRRSTKISLKYLDTEHEKFVNKERLKGSLVYCVSTGDLKNIKLLLKEHPSYATGPVGMSGITLLSLAVARGHKEMVQYLLTHKSHNFNQCVSNGECSVLGAAEAIAPLLEQDNSQGWVDKQRSKKWGRNQPFSYSKHAKQQAEERGIELNTIRQVIQNPHVMQQSKQSNDVLKLMDKNICVVVATQENEINVITTYRINPVSF